MLFNKIKNVKQGGIRTLKSASGRVKGTINYVFFYVISLKIIEIVRVCCINPVE